MSENIRKIYVSGHRNPDIDSIASAAALAQLRKRQGYPSVQAICPGILQEKAKFLFQKFSVEPPPSVNDIWLRVEDIMQTDIPVIHTGTPLLEAVKMLNTTGFQRLPVVAADGTFSGMLSPLTLLSDLLDIGRDSGTGLTGRKIHSSIDLITKVLDAEKTVVFHSGKEQDFRVYVAAMGFDSFETHLPKNHEDELAIICGDRPEIHLRSIQRKIRLMIVTGEIDPEPLILKSAESAGVSILRTKLDSASVIRRLKFSAPVEYFGFRQLQMVLAEHDRLRDLSRKILANPEDVIPVVNEKKQFKGIVMKHAVTDPPPYRMILVDHNECDQSIPGAEEIPVIEVVDHHRMGMMPTAVPIRFTGDIVGSTCTLVSAMYKSSGESLNPSMAGILLGGIVSDTLDLKSPTTSPLDRRMYEWLEKISGVKGTALMEELSSIDSPLASKSPEEVINSDRKTYTDGRFKFSVSQVEETHLEIFRRRLPELEKVLKDLCTAEGLSFMVLMVTDAVRENSEMLYFGSAEVRRELPFTLLQENLFALPGILSRKKQLLPQLLTITASLS